MKPSLMSAEDWQRFSTLLSLIRAGAGVGPSFREIGQAWGIRGMANVVKYLGRLRADGLIDWMPRRARSIRIAKHLVPDRDSSGNMVFTGGRAPEAAQGGTI